MSPIPHIDLDDPESLDPADPSQRSRKLWVMVLLLAVKDMATVVRFEPHRGKRSLIYRVNGLYQDLMSPPRELAGELIEHIEQVIDERHHGHGFQWLGDLINRFRTPEPTAMPKALVELRIEDQVVDAIISIPVTRFGRSVTIALVDGTEWSDTHSVASLKATAILKRMLHTRQRDRPEDQPS